MVPGASLLGPHADDYGEMVSRYEVKITSRVSLVGQNGV